MLTMVEVRAMNGQTLPLPLMDASSGYIVRDIDGLDPVKATIASSKIAQVDGATFQASRRETRNIVMKIGLEPDYVTTSVSGLRQGLYRYLMPKTPLMLRFYLDDEEFADIAGTVESFDTALFTDDPEVSISILCFDPDFYSTDPTVLTGSSTSGSTRHEHEYEGTVETGVLFTNKVTKTTQNVVLENMLPDGTRQRMEITGAGLLSGDTLEISSIQGNKHVERIRGSVRTSLLHTVSPASAWVQLYPGLNSLLVQDLAGSTWTVTYDEKYGGL